MAAYPDTLLTPGHPPMSLALTHFAVGAIGATLSISYLFPDRTYTRTLVVASGT